MKKGAKDEEVIEHWYSLVREENFSSSEFYDAIEVKLRSHEVPGLSLRRIDLLEGGALSDKRQYLRMQRERLTFDLCAAPVGVNYFFSYRFYLPKVRAGVFCYVAVIMGLGLLWALFAASDVYYGSAAFVVVLLIGLTMMLSEDEAHKSSLLEMPVLGDIYEQFFFKDTYYRKDMRMAYCSIVSTLVKEEFERVTAAKGVKLVREHTYSPQMDALYTVKESRPKSKDSGEGDRHAFEVA